ncbi:hypothetical protein PGT21_016277 [Puccinia graminis f. sp. tritici]|uniref:Uncharacterized protein n=1 Tax=Puccinia graminis f. sp. tritici TaxID=56615 RepID=A0A5B0QIQ3_PUCGR|nr:hypothetical protein PGT21_016277 [Puccinia graminis f. sp. tritici]KAA1135784.1 hypothetical protein PGTUg99_024022 [Puccinia graminis f. sp. tritici]
MESPAVICALDYKGAKQLSTAINGAESDRQPILDEMVAERITASQIVARIFPSGVPRSNPSRIPAWQYYLPWSHGSFSSPAAAVPPTRPWEPVKPLKGCPSIRQTKPGWSLAR